MTKVVARDNLPVQGQVFLLALVYILYSKVYDFAPIFDWAVGCLLGLWLVLEIRLFLTQQPVNIFKEEESE